VDFLRLDFFEIKFKIDKCGFIISFDFKFSFGYDMLSKFGYIILFSYDFSLFTGFNMNVSFPLNNFSNFGIIFKNTEIL
jgi:hypothetical protein